jgi:hypothetical protein
VTRAGTFGCFKPTKLESILIQSCTTCPEGNRSDEECSCARYEHNTTRTLKTGIASGYFRRARKLGKRERILPRQSHEVSKCSIRFRFWHTSPMNTIWCNPRNPDIPNTKFGTHRISESRTPAYCAGGVGSTGKSIYFRHPIFVQTTIWKQSALAFNRRGCSGLFPFHL